MSALLWIGAALALAGVAVLGWCIAQASRLRAGTLPSAEVAARLRTLVAANAVAVGLAFLGLALMLAGALL